MHFDNQRQRKDKIILKNENISNSISGLESFVKVSSVESFETALTKLKGLYLWMKQRFPSQLSKYFKATVASLLWVKIP